MSESGANRGKLVTVILKDGMECSGRLFMTVSTSANRNSEKQERSTTPKRFIYLQIGESRKVVRFNEADILEVHMGAGIRDTASRER